MFSLPLFKRDIKENYRYWGLMTGVLVLFIVTFLLLTNSMSNDRSGGSAGQIMIQQFYSMFAVLLPMLFIVSTSNKLIVAQVDRGSLAYVMVNPLKRNQVSITHGVFLASSLVAMFAFISVAGAIVIIATGAALELKAFLLLNLGALLLNLAASGIAYFSTCIFNSSRNYLIVGAGVPVVFFIFNLLANMGTLVENMQYFKYATIYTLFNQTDVMAYNSSIIWKFFVLAGISVIGYLAGIVIFKKKDLPV